HAGEITNQKHHIMAHILEPSHFVQQNGMTKVQVGRGRVKPRFDDKPPSAGSRLFKVLAKVILRDDLVRAANDFGPVLARQRILRSVNANNSPSPRAVAVSYDTALLSMQ